MAEYTCPICGQILTSLRGIEGLFPKAMDHMAAHIQEASETGSGIAS